tara:strand:+ start:37 stop:798 length:762 start_codon:yes stop_codon:yes gene_type:complete
MKSISELKSEALSSLNEKWGISVGCTLIFFVISIALSLIPYIGDIASILVSGALSVGLCNFFLLVSKSENVEIDNLFVAFKSKDLFLSSLVAYLLSLAIIIPTVIIFGAIWVALFLGDIENLSDVILGAVNFEDSPYSLDPNFLNEHSSPIFDSGIVTVLLSLFIIVLVPLIIVSLILSQVFFILADKKTYSGLEAIKMSWNLMKNKKTKLFLLQLSFIGWVILSILTLFIGFIFLQPYIYTTLSKFYKELND